MNRRSLLSIALGFLVVPSSACAETRSWPGAVHPAPRETPREPLAPRPEPSTPNYRLTLESSDGVTLPSFRQRGRTFVLGERGERYAIRVDNPLGERIEVVISVDGRDAVSGDEGDYRSQRGYLIPPYGSLRVEGFRQSLEDVATFRFSSPGESYSSRRGTPENVGVIGVAVYRERRQPIARPTPPRPFHEPQFEARERREVPPPSRSRAPEKQRAPGAASAPEAERSARGRAYDEGSVNNLGTEYGETRASAVVEVPFERRTREPERILSVRYDDAAGLERRGIDVSAYYEPRYPREPEAFPRTRFAPPPR